MQLVQYSAISNVTLLGYQEITQKSAMNFHEISAME